MDKTQFTHYIQRSDFIALFNQLGWDHFDNTLPIAVNDDIFQLEGIVEKKGFVILRCQPTAEGAIPVSALRRQIEQRVTQAYFEHLIIYTNHDRTHQIWQLALKEEGKPKILRDISYHTHQDPEGLFQRLRGLLFTLDEEDAITLVDVKARVAENFARNTEKVTKKFYTEFKKQHTAFLGFIEGIHDSLPDKENTDKQWYASLMLNRLMFCYFIQKKGFLDRNPDYLQVKLKESGAQAGEDQFYSFYRDFLLRLFHEGLGRPEAQRSGPVDFGRIPYLNGGLFDIHELEQQFAEIRIKDEAFERIFTFFDEWNWHLDTRVEAGGNDINPDVIGYIFEKYINDRAAMGAYYTKDDITEYIGKNCILPFLCDDVKRRYPKAFASDGEFRRALQHSGDTYIYDAVKHGVELDVPEHIAVGLDTTQPNLLHRRKDWNTPTPIEYGLPTEIWRETIERRTRYAEVKQKIEQGRIVAINDFITYNLNIRQFLQDIIEQTGDADLIRHLYKAILAVTVLDPTCGSGAFLFAALNILEPLYEGCLQRMELFTAEQPGKHKFFEKVLQEAHSAHHPNLQYFIYKSIILNNLYGVDLMREAVEIAKLRLFLKLVASVDPSPRKPNYGLEPLPDIDFNIRAGNTLIGFATEQELLDTITQREGLFANDKLAQFKEQCQVVSQAFSRFKDAQLVEDAGSESFKTTKQELIRRLNTLNNELSRYLASNYGISEANIPDSKKREGKYQKWLETHQPFHWFAEFYDIIAGYGGFDVIIGNPPYVEYSKVKKNYQILSQYYDTESAGNLYALCIERSLSIEHVNSQLGMIVQQPITSTQRMKAVRDVLIKHSNLVFSSTFDDRPSKLFEGIHHARMAILLAQKKQTSEKAFLYVTQYNKWYKEESKELFSLLSYIEDGTHSVLQVFPKIKSNTEKDIIAKLLTVDQALVHWIVKHETDHKIYYKITGVGHWFTITIRPPRFFRDEIESSSTRESTITFQSEQLRNCAFIILNSSLFYWYYQVRTNCRDFNPSDYKTFPIPQSLNSPNFSSIAAELQENLDLGSTFINMNHSKTGPVKLEQFKPRVAKSTIDDIDKILAEHYGFTEEELDFIINYDIKYRMGKELNNDE